MVARNVRIANSPRVSTALSDSSRWRRRTDGPRLVEPGKTDDLHEARGMLVAILFGAAFSVALIFAVRFIIAH